LLLGVVVLACNLSTWKAEAGIEAFVVYSKTLSQKKKREKRRREEERKEQEKKERKGARKEGREGGWGRE
jgi:hypothetical protein